MARIVYEGSFTLDDVQYTVEQLRATLDMLLYRLMEFGDDATGPALVYKALGYVENTEEFIAGCEDGG